jgi:hypothetical protein
MAKLSFELCAVISRSTFLSSQLACNSRQETLFSLRRERLLQCTPRLGGVVPSPVVDRTIPAATVWYLVHASGRGAFERFVRPSFPRSAITPPPFPLTRLTCSSRGRRTGARARGNGSVSIAVVLIMCAEHAARSEWDSPTVLHAPRTVNLHTQIEAHANRSSRVLLPSSRRRRRVFPCRVAAAVCSRVASSYPVHQTLQPCRLVRVFRPVHFPAVPPS